MIPGLINIVLVSKDVQEARFAICLACPHYNTVTKKCRQCGCYMPVKTKLTKATCPLKKW